MAQWFRVHLGWRLGIMVGALTLGTAVPYLFFAVGVNFNWRHLMLLASVLAAAGGFIVNIGIPEGPYLREIPRFEARAAFRIFRYRAFRLQALGYFGHMWELYAFWALSASYLSASFSRSGSRLSEAVSLIAFLAIGIGIFGCVLGGWVSRFVGEKAVALASLAASGLFCALSGLLFKLPGPWLVLLLLIWGIFVVSDSPQFSALAARFSPAEYTGTALTIQNGVGFAITVISIQFIAWVSQHLGWQWSFTFLAAGPIAGAAAMARLRTSL